MYCNTESMTGKYRTHSVVGGLPIYGRRSPPQVTGVGTYMDVQRGRILRPTMDFAIHVSFRQVICIDIFYIIRIGLSST
jgi:hypothetical protein